MSCGVGHRRSSDPEMPWLWWRLAATAAIGPLAWEPPYAVEAALGKTKRQKKKKKKGILHFFGHTLWHVEVPGLGFQPTPQP